MQDKSSRSNESVWGSDVVAQALREQDFPYVCLNPGASYRGLHDSIVNHLGNENPHMLLCLHEEHAVAMAQGFAKVTGQPICAIVHSNVGLLHASMAIFNAWCDRSPVVVLGATGPVDAENRRPWIDWIHTSSDQGALVRDYTKWDDQPGSPAAAAESIRRATMLARTDPCGPVYINLDVGVQLAELSEWPATHDLSRYQQPQPAAPAPADLEAAAKILQGAKAPIIFCGRVSRSEEGWRQRIELAEALGARVYTSGGDSASFPSAHPQHGGRIGFTLRGPILDELREADAVLNLDWTDLGGTLNQIWPAGGDLPPIVNCSVDFHVHRGWNMDYQKLAPADLRIATTPDLFVSAILEVLGDGKAGTYSGKPPPAPPAIADVASSGEISLPDMAAVYLDVTKDMKILLAGNPIMWPNDALVCDHPLDQLGGTGGGGLGGGPGLAVGAALAIKHTGSDRICVAILGDGDYLMGANALWTAASNDIPMLIVTANNRSYFNDVLHQERVAVARGRPVENRFIGQEIDGPPPDLAGLARAQGFEGEGPVTDLADLRPALEKALDHVAKGGCYLLDVVITMG